MLQKVKSEKFWKSVRENSAYEGLISFIKQVYTEHYDEVIPSLPYRELKRFYTDGDRAGFESLYFRRRRFMSAVAILALLYPEEERYLNELQDIIWAVCDEYCWAVPAHSVGIVADDNENIDLFIAETAFAFSEIYHLLGDRFDRIIGERMVYEVRRRVIEPFTKHKYLWENLVHNWTTVCACGVGAAMYYLEPELFESNMPRLMKCMDNLISGFPEDGTCLEGHSYWLYGFSHYTWLADLIYSFTDGKTDLLKSEKIERIASYMQRNFLKGDTSISFADGTRNGKADIATQYYLHSKLPHAVSLLPERLCNIWGGNVPWANYLRTFAFFDPDKRVETTEVKDWYLSGAQQMIFNREKYSFAIKGGHNAEPHNHNDIGNFIMSDESGQVFCDLGAGKYNKAYFEEGRYNILCASSLGHNVPIIAGKTQKAGRKYKGYMTYENGCVKIEFAEAYDIPTLRGLTRTVMPNSDGVILTDSFDTDETEITERFVTLIEPRLDTDAVCVGGIRLMFDSKVCTPSVKVEKMETSGRGQPPVLDVYCIDIVLKSGVKEVSFEFKVQ